ncbi:hypothetical protein SteCoe_14592 [Stentor coeruleus]|uniref:Kelch motif family protein n=1 Tax=Stentor coeruleus TaxID=5963 RepID=A0A1R2C5L8_9CILI|nr:hypothetical protein SteCoe_14592 [Stentor coeruleus]
MFTERRFFQREYENSPSPQPNYGSQIPKIIYKDSPSSMFLPALRSTKNIKKDLIGKRNGVEYFKHSDQNIFAYGNGKKTGKIQASESYKNLSITDNLKKRKSALLDRSLLMKTNYFLYSIFEIYGSGYSYSTKIGYGSSMGIGFLISNTLAITSNTVIPHQDIGSKCFARFADNIYETHNFDANIFFYTNPDLNFTIIGFVANIGSKMPRMPLEIREDFVLKEGENVVYLDSGPNGKTVVGVEDETFSYAERVHIQSGMPIFTSDWHLQGLHHSYNSSYNLNQATRIDSIANTLFKSQEQFSHPDLDLLLTNYESRYQNPNQNLQESQYIYFIEWYNRNIYTYNIELEKWGKLKISNLDDFLKNEQNNWNFNWGSRIVYLSNKIFILGGVSHEIYSAKSDVYELNIDTMEIFRKMDMNERREGLAAVYKQDYIYVMGGRYSYNTCERYSICEDKWEVMGQMNYGRYEHVAIIMAFEKLIFVVGGLPQENVGKIIERYDIVDDRWDVITMSLPYPVVHPGIFQVSGKKFALLGGRFCRAILIVELINSHLVMSQDFVYSDCIRVYQIDPLPERIETVYPVILYKKENKLCLVKFQEGDAPKVIFYYIKNFHKPPNTIQNYNKATNLPPIINRPNNSNTT